MLIHKFPDLNWLKTQAASSFANKRGVDGRELKNEGWPNVVLNTKTGKVVRDDIPGPLSIFANVAGTSHVTIDKRRIAVSPGTFFISNAGQRYTLEVDDRSGAETFNIHFGEKFASEALKSLTLSGEQLLENEPGSKPVPGFHNRLVTADEEFQSLVLSIRMNGTDEAKEDELLYQMLTLLARQESDIEKMSRRINVVKASTREEILKRLLLATDFLYSTPETNPGLDDLSSIACLSKFHFLRLFKLAYGQTPHQFSTAIKVERAKELLNKTKEDVKSIADRLGFENASTFSRTFRNAVGVYPTQYRLA